MPDDLYDRVALAWSEHQAGLLWRGERVNEVDWEHVVEEIEDVGLSELLARGMHRLPKGAARRFAPSMRQRIDLPAICRDALELP
jgi:hypothetical protein